MTKSWDDYLPWEAKPGFFVETVEVYAPYKPMNEKVPAKVWLTYSKAGKLLSASKAFEKDFAFYADAKLNYEVVQFNPTPLPYDEPMPKGADSTAYFAVLPLIKDKDQEDGQKTVSGATPEEALANAAAWAKKWPKGHYGEAVVHQVWATPAPGGYVWASKS